MIKHVCLKEIQTNLASELALTNETPILVIKCFNKICKSDGSIAQKINLIWNKIFVFLKYYGYYRDDESCKVRVHNFATILSVDILE